MGKALSYAIRQKIISRKENGQIFKQISKELGCSESGVKKIWYGYKKEGNKVLITNYSNCGRKSTYPQSVHSAVEVIRDNKQGSNYVHSKLLKDYPELSTPSSRTLTRWWKKQGSNRKPGRPRASEKKAGQQMHIIPGK